MTQTVRIHYRRLPDRVQVFEQELVVDAGAYIVTFLPTAAIPKPVRVGGQVVLEPGSPVVWFTYPGIGYDAGRFHRADGTFTGVYANLLTPVQIRGDSWRTTDLCLDVWAGADGTIEILDEDEFAEAVHKGWIDTATAEAARAQAEALAAEARQGNWPPQHIQDWTLKRVLNLVSKTNP
jgi:predicted RNA-binding protein associated with RNAse of E/G family